MMTRSNMNYPYPYDSLGEYAQLFTCVRMERQADGVLEITLHTDGGELCYRPSVHRELSQLWGYVGRDPENKVIILTGSGEAFLRKHEEFSEWIAGITPAAWAIVQEEARRFVVDFLEIDQPVIAALNGPVSIQSQIPMLCDVVLATPDTEISDTHLPGALPTDGHQVVWPLLMGLNRAKYALLTRKVLSATEAFDLGIANEIVPRDRLLERAHGLAQELLEISPAALRQFRPMMMQHVKRLMLDDLSQGCLAAGLPVFDLAREGSGSTGSGGAQ